MERTTWSREHLVKHGRLSEFFYPPCFALLPHMGLVIRMGSIYDGSNDNTIHLYFEGSRCGK
jgi:hypothetical protein